MINFENWQRLGAEILVRGGKKDIYIMRIDGKGQKRITGFGGNNILPSWSN